MIIEENVFMYDGEARPERPSIHHVFIDGNWQINIDSCRFYKLNDIKKAYQTAISTGLATSKNLTVSCLQPDIQQIKNDYELMVLTGQNSVFVEDFYGASHEISLADMLQILKEIGGYLFNINTVNKTLKDSVATATSQEQINAIKWPD